MKPAEFEALNHLVVITSNSISLILCGILICSVLIFVAFKRKLLSYTSYIVSVFILIADTMYASFQITAVTTSSPSVCSLSSWGVVFSTVFSMQLACVLALQLQLIVVHNIKPAKWINFIYVLVPLNVSTIVSLLPVVFGKIGHHQEENWASCWYHNEASSVGKAWSFSTFYGWIIFAIVYCSLVVTVVVVRLCRFNSLKKHFPDNAYTINALKRSIKVILLYPLVPLVCYFFAMCTLFFRPTSYYFLLMSSCLQGLQGTFNAIIFISNPILIREVKTYIKKWNNECLNSPKKALSLPFKLGKSPNACYLPK